MIVFLRASARVRERKTSPAAQPYEVEPKKREDVTPTHTAYFQPPKKTDSRDPSERWESHYFSKLLWLLEKNCSRVQTSKT